MLSSPYAVMIEPRAEPVKRMAIDLVVACIHTGGDFERVRRLRDAVGLRLAIPHTMVCLTNRPDWCEGVVFIDITEAGLPGRWVQMMLFEPQWRGRSKIIFLDLDIRVAGDLAPLARVPGEFAICADDGGGYDARVMVIGGGLAGFVWTRFEAQRDAMMGRHWTAALAIEEIYPGAPLLQRLVPRGFFGEVIKRE